MILIDLIISELLIVLLKLESFAGFFAIVFVLFTSIILYYLIKRLNNNLSAYFLINIFFAPVLLFSLILFRVLFQARATAGSQSFLFNNESYILRMEKKNAQFEIYKLIDGDRNHLRGISYGKFLKKNDTIYLLYNKKIELFIYKDALSGFPVKGSKILLKNE